MKNNLIWFKIFEFCCIHVGSNSFKLKYEYELIGIGLVAMQRQTKHLTIFVLDSWTAYKMPASNKTEIGRSQFYGRHRRHKIKHGIIYYLNIFAIRVLILHIFIHCRNVNNVWFYTFAALAHLAEINSRRNVRIKCADMQFKIVCGGCPWDQATASRKYIWTNTARIRTSTTYLSIYMCVCYAVSL